MEPKFGCHSNILQFGPPVTCLWMTSLWMTVRPPCLPWVAVGDVTVAPQAVDAARSARGEAEALSSAGTIQGGIMLFGGTGAME